MGTTPTTRLPAADRPASCQHPATPEWPKRARRKRIGRASSLLISTLGIAALTMVGMPGAALAQTAAASPQWQMQNLTAQPPAGPVGNSMAADPANRTVVLFTGPSSCGPLTCTNQTWTWDGTRWTHQTPKHSPSPRGDAAMAYDPATRTVVLFGGWTIDPTFTANPPVGYFGDTWTWNGTDWTEQHPTRSPGARLTSLVTDPATGSVLLEGGQHTDPSKCSTDGVGCFFEPVIDTWTWNGHNWLKRHPHTQPTLGFGAMFASDPATRTVVLFGGGSPFAGPQSDQTWTWDGRDWTRRFPLVHPDARTGNGLAYDPATRSVVLFGGEQAPFPTVNGETWTWDGTGWTQQFPLQSPSSRVGPGMTTDPATCSVVLFGGEDASGALLGDTWVYASPGGAPDQSNQPAAAQDEHEGSANCSPGED